MPKTRRILITSALPYANGHIHLGHLVEYIQTDIFTRFQRLYGNQAIYLCADDTHGTAIMIRAQTENRTEQELIAAMRDAHLADFEGFQIAFDHYGSTDSSENGATAPASARPGGRDSPTTSSGFLGGAPRQMASASGPTGTNPPRYAGGFSSRARPT